MWSQLISLKTSPGLEVDLYGVCSTCVAFQKAPQCVWDVALQMRCMDGQENGKCVTTILSSGQCRLTDWSFYGPDMGIDYSSYSHVRHSTIIIQPTNNQANI